MSDYLLGKKIVPPAQPKEDVIEETGRPGVYRVNGKLVTDFAPLPPAPIPVPEVDILFSTKRWDEMTGILQQQEDDGFPVLEFAVM